MILHRVNMGLVSDETSPRGLKRFHFKNKAITTH